MDDANEPGLVRYWFDFDVSDYESPPAPPGTIRLDGGHPTHHFLGQGVGVTGYDRDDCLALLRRLLDGDLPPITREVRQPVVTDQQARQGGNPVWRGVWSPPLNREGPTLD